jgi:hypothetical protein
MRGLERRREEYSREGTRRKGCKKHREEGKWIG